MGWYLLWLLIVTGLLWCVSCDGCVMHVYFLYFFPLSRNKTKVEYWVLSFVYWIALYGEKTEHAHTHRKRERDYIMQTVLLKTLRGIHHCMSHKCVNVRLIYFCSLIISLLSLSCILLLSLIFLSIRQKERLFCSSTYEACIYAFKDNEIHHTDSINSSLTNADVLTCRQPIKYIVIWSAMVISVLMVQLCPFTSATILTTWW